MIAKIDTAIKITDLWLQALEEIAQELVEWDVENL